MCYDVTHAHEYHIFTITANLHHLKITKKVYLGKPFFLHLHQFSAMNLPL